MTSGTEPSIGFHRWRLPMRAIMVIALLGLTVVACGGSDEAEAIYGTWYVGYADGYETFEPDGTWSVREGTNPTPLDWGTYTLEDGILRMINADDSYCPGGSAVFEVTFSEDGNEVEEKVVSESCSNSSVRGRDRVLVREAP